MNRLPKAKQIQVVAALVEGNSIRSTVRITGAPPETVFRAYWFEGDTILGQSEVTLPASDEPTRWVALGFRAPAALNPAAPHAVELRINDRKIDTYTFRVGVGAIEDVIAEASMALGTRDEVVVGRGELFDVLAGQLVAVVRVSNVVDPTGMIFTVFWYRGDTLVGQGQPDGGQPRLSPEPQPLERRLTFTFAPAGGESGLQVTARALPALLQLVERHEGKPFVVVSHKATIRLVLSSLLGFDPRKYRDRLDQNPAALNILDFKDLAHARLTLFNDVSHYASESRRPRFNLSSWWDDAGDGPGSR